MAKHERVKVEWPWVLVDQINDQVVGPFQSRREAKVYVVDQEWGTDGWVILPLMPPEVNEPEVSETGEKH